MNLLALENINVIDIVILVVVAIVIILAATYVIIKKKSGGCNCGCSSNKGKSLLADYKATQNREEKKHCSCCRNDDNSKKEGE